MREFVMDYTVRIRGTSGHCLICSYIGHVMKYQIPRPATLFLLGGRLTVGTPDFGSGNVGSIPTLPTVIHIV